MHISRTWYHNQQALDWMSEDKLPTILEGQYFSIVSIDNATKKVIANCNSCPKGKEISGSLVATSNFIRHLKVQYFIKIILSFLCDFIKSPYFR